MLVGTNLRVPAAHAAFSLTFMAQPQSNTNRNSMSDEKSKSTHNVGKDNPLIHSQVVPFVMSQYWRSIIIV